MRFFIIKIFLYLNLNASKYDVLLTKKVNSVRLLFLDNW
jgi:hypothetical protein